MRLERYGWNEAYEQDFIAARGQREDLVPGRVTSVARSLLEVELEAGARRARLSGRLLRESKETGMPAAVGDWVVCRDGGAEEGASVVEILPRKTSIERKRAISGGRRIVDGEVAGGRTEAQVVASNVDFAFIVTPLGPSSEPGEGFSRIERSMAICAAGGVRPVAVYNKADLVDPGSLDLIVETALSIAPEALAVSAMDGSGVERIAEYLSTGKTAVFFGPSGAGKSSIINALMSEGGSYAEGFVPLDTGPLSGSTGKGLHTTTSRELFILPGGGIVVDTPGMRELALWADESALGEAFSDIEKLASSCRFSDCAHRTEPGCRVQEALENGVLDGRRYENWRKMRGEIGRLDMRKIALWSKQNARSKRYFDEDHR